VTPLPERSVEALDPVRAALLADARSRAEHLLRSAQEEADAVRAAAQHEADAILAEAVADGERTARSAAAQRSARVRREAHETVLARQSAIRAELQRQVAESAAALRTDPRYAELMARLTEHSRAVLGPDAAVSPSPLGGVVARSGTRHLDLSLPTLAAQTLESMAPEVSALWTP
jgi:vacuolar-type H+-ATPase subunit E/Vma4